MPTAPELLTHHKKHNPDVIRVIQNGLKAGLSVKQIGQEVKRRVLLKTELPKQAIQIAKYLQK